MQEDYSLGPLSERSNATWTQRSPEFVLPSQSSPPPPRSAPRLPTSPTNRDRLVVVSNRVGYPYDAKNAGGLAVALGETLDQTGGMWFGWSGAVEATPLNVPTLAHHGSVDVATLALTPAEMDGYYNGFANSTLWPLFHSNLERTRFARDDAESYHAVNQRFAAALYPLLEGPELIWIHDYHFIPLGKALRELGCEQPLGFFLHIPFPSPEVLRTLPGHQELVRALMAYDLIGFQTERDRRCFLAYLLDEADGQQEGGDIVHAFGQSARCQVFPIGIDMDAFRDSLHSPAAIQRYNAVRKTFGRNQLMVGVDRLDYTKGIPTRFEGISRYLDRCPQSPAPVSFLQIAPISRGDVAEYAQLRHELEHRAGTINAAHSTLDSAPLCYVNQSFGRADLAGIFLAARAALVTPLRDGMNLVAKEFVAAQSEDDPGVLILSRFAGAAEHADGAVLVNPYDADDLADAIECASLMPYAERLERWQSLYREFDTYDVERWRETFLAQLSDFVLPSARRCPSASAAA